MSGAGRRTRLTLSAAATSSASPASASSTPPGRSRRRPRARRGSARAPCEAGEHVDDAAGHVGRREDLGEGDRRQRRVSVARTTTALPLTRAGATRETRPERAGSRGHDPDDAGRLRDGEVEVRAGDGVDAPRTWGILSAQPAYQTQRSMARRRPRCARRSATSAHDPPLRRLHHLGDAVQDLAAVVRGRARPAGERLARGHDGVAQVLARPRGGVRGPRPRHGATGLRPRERAADVELVGLADVDAAHESPLQVRPRARGGRPRGRSRTPCSRRTATSGRTG